MRTREAWFMAKGMDGWMHPLSPLFLPSFPLMSRGVVSPSFLAPCFAKSRVCLPPPSQKNLYDLHLYKDSHLVPMQVQLGFKLNRYPFLEEAVVARFCFSEQHFGRQAFPVARADDGVTLRQEDILWPGTRSRYITPPFLSIS